jgi:TonB family protein
MSILTLILFVLIKPVILFLLGAVVVRTLVRDSAGFQHQVLVLLLLALPVIVIGSLLGLVDVPISLAVDSPWLITVSDQYTLIFVFVWLSGTLTILLYRALTLFELGNRESRFAQAPAQIYQQATELLQGASSRPSHCDMLQYDSPTVGAYVWRRRVFGEHRLVTSTAINKLPRDQQRIVLAHECAHIRRNDWLLQQACFCVCAIFWFLLPAWWWLRRLTGLAEAAADDLAIEMMGGRDTKALPAGYAEFLLTAKQQAAPASPAVSNAVIGAGFYQRINYLLEHFDNHQSNSRADHMLAAGIVILWVLPLTLLSADISVREPVPTSRLIWLATSSQNQALPDLTPKQWREKLMATVVAPKPSPDEILVEADMAQLKSPERNAVGNVRWQGLLPEHMVMPIYPDSALSAGIEAGIAVTFDVDHGGRATNIIVYKSDHSDLFKRSVETALRASQFQPLVVNNKPILIKNVQQEFVFSIDSI